MKSGHFCCISTIMGLFFYLLLTQTNIIYAKSIDIVEQGQYWGSQEESLDTMKTMAKHDAWRRAIERAAVLVQSFSVMQASKIDIDTIRTLSEGLVYVQEAPKYHMEKKGNGTLVTAKVHVVVEADEEILQERLQDRQALAESKHKYKEIEEKYARIHRNIQALQAKIKQYGPSAVDLTSLKENEQDLRLNDLLNESERYLQQKKMTEAEKILDQAVSQFPNASATYSARARCHMMNAIITKDIFELESTTILADANKALELNHSNIEAYHAKITYYVLQKRLEDAMETVQKCLNNDPKDAQAYMYRSIIYKDLKDYDKALQDLNLAIQLNPDLGDFTEIQNLKHSILKKNPLKK